MKEMPVIKSEASESEKLRAQRINDSVQSRTHHENTRDASVDWLYRMLGKRQSVSETIAIKPDGSLNSESTTDLERPVLINSLMDMELTSNGLMKACKEVSDAHPEFQFSFKTDPAGRSITYTVTRRSV